MNPIEGSETSAISNQTPGKHPKENIVHVKHGESLKSRMFTLSYRSLSTTDVAEQVFFMYEVPWFCSSVLGIFTYQGILLREMYIKLYVNFYFVLE
jgi:hypothetical protein